MYAAAGIIEGMGAGWDFSWIDMQHGQHDFASTLGAIRAAECMKLHPVVRVPGQASDAMSKVADMDPDAVMVPMVNTVEQAAHVAQSLHFPPVGDRSYGGRRVIDRHGRDFHRCRDLLVIVQIESLAAADNAEAIAAVEGVDMLFFGADDMKLRMGLDLATATHENDQLIEAQRHVAYAARAAGKWAGIVAMTPESLRLAVEFGYQMIVGGVDVIFLRSGAGGKLKVLRGVVDGLKASSGSERHEVHSS